MSATLALMKAIVIPRIGRASVLEVRELPDPLPGPGEVRIAVRAAGLNFAEVSARQGIYPDAPPLPTVVGYEVAGTIDALGKGVEGLAIGERVWALCRFGGHAELVCTRADLVRPMPSGLSFVEAAAIPVAYSTAVMLVSSYGRVRPNERVLIHMAAGGVGVAAIQLCRRVPGVTIFGTASASKHDFLRKMGVDHPIDYRTRDFETEVRALTNGRGVHLVLDPMGGRHWRKNYRLLAPLGRLMLYGVANAARSGTRSLLRVAAQVLQSPHWRPMQLMDGNRAVMGLNLGKFFDEPEVISAGLDELATLVNAGVARPMIDRVFPFSEAAAAHERIERRENIGKVVLVPSSPADAV
jgi:NADPH:quinone reductase-like Zn-dependent oxidoreductase